MRTSPLLATVPSLSVRQNLLDAIKAEARRRGMTMGRLAMEAGLPAEAIRDRAADWRAAQSRGPG